MVQTGPHHILSNASDQTHLSLMGKTLELAPAASELPGCYVAVSCRAASPWVQAAHTLLRKCLPCPATEAPARSGPLRRLPPALSRCAEDRASMCGARFAAAASSAAPRPCAARRHLGQRQEPRLGFEHHSLVLTSAPPVSGCGRKRGPRPGPRGPRAVSPDLSSPCRAGGKTDALSIRQTPRATSPVLRDVTRVSGSTMLHAGDPPAPPEWGTEHPGVSSASSMPTTASLWSRHVTQLSCGATSRQKSLAEQ